LRTGAARSEPASGKKGALVIAIMDPRGNDGALAARASRRFTALRGFPASRSARRRRPCDDRPRSLASVSVIHPGKPRNPDEPGLEELMKRADLIL
jgi:hypothetical protein